MALTARARRFVAEYLVDLNATQAAIRAGYSAKSAGVAGPRLLGNVRVRAAISAAAKPKLERLEFDADRVLQGAARLAFFDIRKVFDQQGRLKPIQELDEVTAAAVTSVDVQTRVSADREAVVIIAKVRLADRLRALELLAKYYGLLKDRVEVEIDDAKLAALPPDKLAAVRKLASEAAEVVAELRR